jgi:nucleoside-diphosphate-sugar epimerase
MRTLEIPRGVYTSTVAVFSDTKGEVPDETYRYEGNHLSEYDRTKWIAHYRVAVPKIEAGLPLTIVMPGVVYGTGDTSGMHIALVDLLRSRLPVTPARTAFCWAHVEDTARGHIQAMEAGKPGETYLITGPRHTFEAAFDLAASIAKVRAPIFHPGPRLMRAMAAMMSGVQGFVQLPPAFTPEALRVLAGTTYFGSNEKAVREIGFTARPLEEGLAQTIEHELRVLGRA